MIIRPATAKDATAIQSLYLETFDESERVIVAKLAVDLLREVSSPPIYSFVAEDDRIIGHISFSPIWNQQSGQLIGYQLAPLAVSPIEQRQGIGGQLVEHGIELLKQQSVDLLIVYGDPNYYSRFGFKRELAKDYQAPHPLQYSFGWQAMSLSSEPTAPAASKIQSVAALDDPALW